MPVYKLILPVIAFSSRQPLQSLQRPGAILSREPEPQTAPGDRSWADDGQAPPPAGKPFG